MRGDVVLGQHVVADQPPRLALSDHVADPRELVRWRLLGELRAMVLRVVPHAPDDPQQLVADLLGVVVGVEHAAVLDHPLPAAEIELRMAPDAEIGALGELPGPVRGVERRPARWSSRWHSGACRPWCWSKKSLSEGNSAADLAAAIGPGLAKSAVAGRVDGKIVDLTTPLHDGANVALLTKKDPEALDVLRHSAAHLMADAILRIFPQAELTIGPAIEDGFYYDIHLRDGGKITPDDFPRIETEMQRVAKEAHPFIRCAVKDDADEVYARYKAIDGGHNKFKAELVDEIRARGDELSFYKHGDFVDLCRGPHVPNTGWLQHTRLTKVSGAYWRGDANREQLVRVYGTAFFSKQELEDYLHQLEEAKRRDHRVLGEQLSLFTFNEEAPGFPFFYPKGATIFNLLVDYMRTLLRRRNYQEVRTPLILSEQLWYTSGHYDNYLENMFFTKLKLRDEKQSSIIHDNVQEERPMAVKPMNCPGHLLVYRGRLHSHNEFPLRIAEMGLVHRRELSGVRHGLFRVQAFTQDDAHHFCTPDQIQQEISMLIRFLQGSLWHVQLG